MEKGRKKQGRTEYERQAAKKAKSLTGANGHVHLASLQVQLGLPYATGFTEAKQLVYRGKTRTHALSLNAIDRLLTWFKGTRVKEHMTRGNQLTKTIIGFRLMNRSRFWECCRNEEVRRQLDLAGATYLWKAGVKPRPKRKLVDLLIDIVCMHKRLAKFPLGKNIPAHEEFRCLKTGLFGKQAPEIGSMEKALQQWTTIVHSQLKDSGGGADGKAFKQTSLARVVADMEAVHALLHFHGSPLLLATVSPMAIAGRLPQRPIQKCIRNKALMEAFCDAARACDPSWAPPEVVQILQLTGLPVVDTLDAIAEESDKVRTARGAKALREYDRAVVELVRAGANPGAALVNVGTVPGGAELAVENAGAAEPALGQERALVETDAGAAEPALGPERALIETDAGAAERAHAQEKALHEADARDAAVDKGGTGGGSAPGQEERLHETGDEDEGTEGDDEDEEGEEEEEDGQASTMGRLSSDSGSSDSVVELRRSPRLSTKAQELITKARAEAADKIQSYKEYWGMEVTDEHLHLGRGAQSQSLAKEMDCLARFAARRGFKIKVELPILPNTDDEEGETTDGLDVQPRKRARLQ